MRRLALLLLLGYALVPLAPRVKAFFREPPVPVFHARHVRPPYFWWYWRAYGILHKPKPIPPDPPCDHTAFYRYNEPCYTATQGVT
jgi:hypothetical protein